MKKKEIIIFIICSISLVGYKEFFNFFNGNITRDEAINKIKKNTRNYAKRQITWNKKYKN